MNLDAIKSIAEPLGMNWRTLAAIASVESSGNGFDKDGQVKVRFEPHHFNKRSETKMPFTDGGKGFSRIASETNRAAYLNACEIDDSAAIESTSFGMFQIMGFHWKSLGYDSPQAFAEGMNYEAGQYRAFSLFIMRNKNLRDVAREGEPTLDDFRKFARTYNGPSNVENYAAKMFKAYQAL